MRSPSTRSTFESAKPPIQAWRTAAGFAPPRSTSQRFGDRDQRTPTITWFASFASCPLPTGPSSVAWPSGANSGRHVRSRAPTHRRGSRACRRARPARRRTPAVDVADAACCGECSLRLRGSRRDRAHHDQKRAFVHRRDRGRSTAIEHHGVDDRAVDSITIAASAFASAPRRSAVAWMPCVREPRPRRCRGSTPPPRPQLRAGAPDARP